MSTICLLGYFRAQSGRKQFGHPCASKGLESLRPCKSGDKINYTQISEQMQSTSPSLCSASPSSAGHQSWLHRIGVALHVAEEGPAEYTRPWPIQKQRLVTTALPRCWQS